MYNKVFYCVLFVALLSFSYGKSLSEKELAKHTGRVASNRLSKNIEDKDGALMLKVAHKLNPNDEHVLLSLALLKRELRPKPAKTKATKEKIVQAYVKRGQYWWKKGIETNIKARYRTMLYFRVSDKLSRKQPVKEVILGLAKLERMGYTATLQQLLSDGQESVRVDEDYAVTGPLAAIPTLKRKLGSDTAKVPRKRKGPPGPRGSIEFKSGDMTFSLTTLTLPPATRRGLYGYLKFDWKLPRKVPYVITTIENPLIIKDNTGRSMIRDRMPITNLNWYSSSRDTGHFKIGFRSPKDDADRISLLKGSLSLHCTESTKTIKQRLPLKTPVTEDGFTITPFTKNGYYSNFSISYTSTGKLPIKAIRGGKNAKVSYSDGTTGDVSYGSVSHGSKSFKYECKIRHNGRTPVAITITYPTKLEVTTYPFEFRNIGFPDSTGYFTYGKK